MRNKAGISTFQDDCYPDCSHLFVHEIEVASTGDN
jgi:hypothetical protein